MKYLYTFSQHNEGFKNTLLSTGLASSLLLSPVNSISKPTNSFISTTDKTQDGTYIFNIKKEVEILSKERKNVCKDQELCNILDSIKSNLYNEDTSVYLELFNRLNKHISVKYGYKISQKDIKDIDNKSIDKASNDKNGIFIILGWLGSVCLAICGVPQAWSSYKDKHSRGISWGFLLLWAFGEIFALAYVSDKLDFPLLMNYAVNILIVGVILYYKRYPKDNSEHCEILNHYFSLLKQDCFYFLLIFF